MKHEDELLYFQMNMLQLEVEMIAMKLENEIALGCGTEVPYRYEDFMNLINKHGVHHNKFPFYSGY